MGRNLQFAFEHPDDAAALRKRYAL